MNTKYDVIVLGTGLKECILSGLLSVSGKKVLHMDRNDYYGGESTSMNLQQIKQQLDGMSEEEAKKWCAANEKTYGRARDYNVDMCPKLIMSGGDMVKILIFTKVRRYVQFKNVDGSYCWWSNKKIYEIPVTPKTALTSSLIGVFQKTKYRSFVQWVVKLDFKDEEYNQKIKTPKGVALGDCSPAQLFEEFGLNSDTIDFTWHCIALQHNEKKIKTKGCVEFIKKCKLYVDSLAIHGKSPYIYPLWGLGQLPEGFSRLAAVHGGVYMLRRPIDKILYDENGKVRGIVSNKEEAYCDQLIADPSYVLGEKDAKVAESGFIALWIVILAGPVPSTKQNSESLQMIFSSKQANHSNDIYLSVLSHGLECAPKNRFVATISTRVPTNDEKAAKSIMSCAYDTLKGVALPGADWLTIRKTYKPCNQKHGDNIYIPSSLDASTHFQLVVKDCLRLFYSMTGQKLDLVAEVMKAQKKEEEEKKEFEAEAAEKEPEKDVQPEKA